MRFIEEEGTRWALLYNDTADCIFPQFCYSSYVKKIRSFLTFDIVVFQWAMSLSSARIVARITGGCGSCPPLGRLVGHSWDSWHFSLRRTDGHADTHAHLPTSSFSLSLLFFFPSLVGLEDFSRRYFSPPAEVVALRQPDLQPRLSPPADGGWEKQQSPAAKSLSSLEETGLTRVPSYSSVG